MLVVRVSTRVRATSGRGRTERSILQYDERSARRRTAARSRSRRGALLKATKTASCPPDVTELVLCPSAAGTRTKRVRPRSIRTRWTQEQQWQEPSACAAAPRRRPWKRAVLAPTAAAPLSSARTLCAHEETFGLPATRRLLFVMYLTSPAQEGA